MKRRDFLRCSSTAAVAALVGGKTASAANNAVGLSSFKAKPDKLIFLVSDGLSAGAVTMTERWCQRHFKRSSNWYQLLQNPAAGTIRCLQDIASADALVPDSAAAGSAWGTGIRIPNNALNFVNGKPTGKPLFVRAKQQGYATGLVTTARITHATPASFVANVPHRREEATIARQYLEREVDLLLGGGWNRFYAADGSPHTVLDDFQNAGYALLCSNADLHKQVAKSKPDKRLLGLFAEDHLPYAIDRRYGGPIVQHDMPSLPDMMTAALDYLRQKPQGFMLQVEAARVDHAAHANDPAGLMHEQLEFDTCIGLALEFLKHDPDTLIIITTDHGCGGPQLNGLWPHYPDTNAAFDSLTSMSASFEYLFQAILEGEQPTALIRQHLQLELPPEEDKEIFALCQSEGAWYGMLSEVLQAQLYGKTAVGWTSQHHTAEAVDLLAIGKGAVSFPGFLKNTDVLPLLTQLFKV